MKSLPLLLALIQGVSLQGSNGPYYGLPMGSFYFSRDGTQGDVYAADPRTIMIVNFHQNAKPGCTTLMAGPVKPSDQSAHVAPKRRGVMLPVSKSVLLDADFSKGNPDFRGKRSKRSLQDRLAAFNPNFLPFMPFQFAQLRLGESANSQSMGGNAFAGIELEHEKSTTTRPTTTTSTPTTTTTTLSTTTPTTTPTTTSTTSTSSTSTSTSTTPTTTTTTTQRTTPTTTPTTTSTTTSTTTTSTQPTTTTTRETTSTEPPTTSTTEVFVPLNDVPDPRLALIHAQYPAYGANEFDYDPFGGGDIQFSVDSESQSISVEDSVPVPDITIFEQHQPQPHDFDSLPETTSSSSTTTTTTVPSTTKTTSTTTKSTTTTPTTTTTSTTATSTSSRNVVDANVDEVKEKILSRKGIVFHDAPAAGGHQTGPPSSGRGIIMSNEADSVESTTVHYWGPLPRHADLFIREDDDKFAFFRRESAEKSKGVTAILGGEIVEDEEEESEEIDLASLIPPTNNVQSRMLNRHIEVPARQTLPPGSPLVFLLGGQTTPPPPVTVSGPGLVEATTKSPSGKTPLWYVVEDPRKQRGRSRSRVPAARKVKESSPVADNLLSNKQTKPTLPEGVNEEFVLPSINGQTMSINLPEDYKLSDFEWFGIYDHCSQLKTAYVRVRDVMPPEEAIVDGIVGTEYGVSSGDIHIVNCNTLLIRDFKYEGAREQDAFIYIGLGDYNHNDVLYQVRAEIVGQEPAEPLRNKDGEDLEIHLPDGWKTFDINFLSVHSPARSRSFGYATIPPVVVPPCDAVDQ